MAQEVTSLYNRRLQAAGIRAAYLLAADNIFEPEDLEGEVYQERVSRLAHATRLLLPCRDTDSQGFVEYCLTPICLGGMELHSYEGGYSDARVFVIQTDPSGKIYDRSDYFDLEQAAVVIEQADALAAAGLEPIRNLPKGNNYEAQVKMLEGMLSTS